MNRFEISFSSDETFTNRTFFKFLGSYDKICNDGGFSRNLVDGKTWRQSTLNKIYNIFLYQSRLHRIPPFPSRFTLNMKSYLIILFCSFQLSPQIVFVRADTRKEDCYCCRCVKLITLLMVHIIFKSIHPIKNVYKDHTILLRKKMFSKEPKDKVWVMLHNISLMFW